MHRDNHNDDQYSNVLVGLGKYTQGGLWIQSSGNEKAAGRPQEVQKELPNGEVVSGSVRETRHRVVTFNPKLWHETQPWKGNRMIVTAFTTRGVTYLSEHDRKYLLGPGFKLPRQGASKQAEAAYPATSEPLPPRRTSRPNKRARS